VALVRLIKPASRERQRVHGPVECTYTAFTEGGEHYLQLDTYGSPDRALAGKMSQSIQFDEVSAQQLYDLLKQAFPRIT